MVIFCVCVHKESKTALPLVQSLSYRWWLHVKHSGLVLQFQKILALWIYLYILDAKRGISKTQLQESQYKWLIATVQNVHKELSKFNSAVSEEHRWKLLKLFIHKYTCSLYFELQFRFLLTFASSSLLLFFMPNSALTSMSHLFPMLWVI